MSTAIYITKYALTRGILEAPQKAPPERGMVTVTWKGGLNGVLYLHSGEWSYDPNEAKKRVRDMIEAKRASLKKSLAKLNRLEESLDE